MKKVSVIVLLVVLLLVSGVWLARTPLAKKNNTKGIEFFSRAEYKLAEKYFTRALQWKNDYEDGLINLVKCQLELQKSDETRQTLDKLIDISPDHAETLALQGQFFVLDQNFKEALEILNRSIARDSLLAYSYFYRGIAHANLGQLEAAASDYLIAQQLDKTNKEALQKGALIFSKLENFEAAIINYNKLLEIDPLNIEALFQRGNFKMQIEDYSGAIDDFSKTIELDNKLAEAYFNRGKSYINLEKYKEAIPDFDRSAALNYKTSGALYNSGLASLKINQLKEAKEYLLQCIAAEKRNEHSGKAYHLLGVLEMMQNNSSASIGYFNRSISLDSTFADAYYNRGIAFGMIKEYNKAIQDLNTCIALGNTSPDVYFARGVNNISLLKHAAGCDDLKKAEEMGHQQAADMRKQYCKQYQ